MKKQLSSNNQAFTIVELLVVIVVIGILAAITIVSYSGISTRARISSLQSDLTNSSKLLKMFYVDNGTYPATVSTDCVTNPTTTTNLCLKPSNGTDFTTTPYIKPTANAFGLTATNGTLVYCITENSAPTLGSCVAPTLATTDPANWIQIGTQIWAKYNLNVGTVITSTITQTNNGGTNVVEKYCRGNTEAGCTNTDVRGIPFGALYQWNEAMNYSTTEGARGICPSGSHVPSDNDWKILEMHLGMTKVQADKGDGSLRGTDQGTKLGSGGISGLNIPFAGFSDSAGYIGGFDYSFLWSSSEATNPNVFTRILLSGEGMVGRTIDGKNSGLSVRCVGN